MHVNHRRGESRAFVLRRESTNLRTWSRLPRSAKPEKRESWARRRAQSRIALFLGREVGRYRRHIRWDWW